MSRLDRLVRSAGPHLHEAEVLLASVLGRRADGRGHAAVVATDRRLLHLGEGFTRTMVEELEYADVTAVERSVEGGRLVLDVLATEARWRLDGIEHEPAAVVALDLIEERWQRRPGGPAAAAGDAGEPPVTPRRVTVLPSPTA